MVHQNKSGFSLIEMVVVVSLVLVTTGGAIAGFTRFNNRQQVVTSVENIKTFIRTAQRRAQAQDTPRDCVFSFGGPANPLYAYRVYAQNNILYQGANCGVLDNITNEGDDHDVDTSIVGEVQQLVLPEGVTVGSDFNIRFMSLYGGVESLDSNTVLVQKGTYSYQFSVEDSGEITEGGWLAIQ